MLRFPFQALILLVTAAPAGAAEVVATPKPRLDLPAHDIGSREVQFSRDGKQLRSQPAVYGDVLVWDVATGKPAKAVRWPDSVSPDGKRAAWIERDAIIVTDTATGKEQYRISDKLPMWTPGPGTPHFSPDGKALYYFYGSAGVYDSRLWLRSVNAAAGGDRRDIVAPQSERLGNLQFAPDGKTFVTSVGKDVLVFDTATGKELVKLTGHTKDVVRVAYSPDGKVVASVGQEHTVRLWDVAAKKLLHTLEGHTTYIDGLAFAPDGKHVFSAGADETLRVWNVESGKEAAKYKPLVPTKQPANVINGRGILSVATSPDGKLLALSGYDRNVKVWETVALVPVAK